MKTFRTEAKARAGERKRKPRRVIQVRVTPADSEGPYTHSLALAGTIHTTHTDVSAEKYKHLVEAYADRHEEQ